MRSPSRVTKISPRSWHISLVVLTTLLGVLLGCKAPGRTISVVLSEEHQTIDGFGGFGPRKVWWDPPPYYDRAYLDDVIDDLGTSILRTELHWDFEPANDNGDPDTFEWSGFRFGPDSSNGKQFAFIRDLRARGLDKLIASVWTPPIWMKLDPDDGLASYCKGQCGGRLNPTMREEFAEYLVAFVRRLKAETEVDLYGLSIQNEPLFANPFQSCVYSPADYAETLKVVGARFRREGLETKLFGPEHMGSVKWNQAFFAELLDDADAAQYLDIYAVHGYLDGATPDYGSADGWVGLFERARAAGKSLWMTETSDKQSGWRKAITTAKAMHLALKHGKINAWVYWYYADSIYDGDSRTPLFDAFKQYYRFIRPGYVMVEANAGDPQLLVTAFKGDSKLVVVVINQADAARTAELDVAGGTVEDFSVYRTTREQGFVEAGTMTGRSFDFPADSISTLVAAVRRKPNN
jgi:glucuronoarabinoxylan endo-1,4-beta-xylanase